MSRVFKPKVAPSKLETKKSEKVPIKVEPKARKLDLGVTLVEETPEKPRVLSASLSATGASLAFGQPKLFGLLPTNGNEKMVERAEPPPPPLAPMNELEEDDDDDGEEEWMMDSSPDIILLNPSSRGRAVGDEMDEDEQEEDEVVMMATPSKPSKGGRGRKRIR